MHHQTTGTSAVNIDSNKFYYCCTKDVHPKAIVCTLALSPKEDFMISGIVGAIAELCLCLWTVLDSPISVISAAPRTCANGKRIRQGAG